MNKEIAMTRTAAPPTAPPMATPSFADEDVGLTLVEGVEVAAALLVELVEPAEASRTGSSPTLHDKL
jgi:hypothetical protein